MRFATIRSMDISNGPGIRVSLFTQGCPFHCKGCFNESTWDFNGGKPFTYEEVKLILELADKDYISGLSILGGEPLIKDNLPELASLCEQFKIKYPDKAIWIWTGSDFNNLLESYKENIWFHKILNIIDVIVDGQFKLELTDPNLKYRGSSNQRVIDLKKTLKNGSIQLLQGVN